MNFCGQQHNKNRKRDLLHVSPEKNICTCSQKTGLFCPAADGSRTRGHALSLSVTHKRLGSRSWGQSLAYFFHLAMLFFFLLPPGQMYSKWEPSFYMGGGGGGSGGGEAPPQTPLHSILNWFHIQDTRNFFGESTCETPRNYARQLDNSKLGGRYADI